MFEIHRIHALTLARMMTLIISILHVLIGLGIVLIYGSVHSILGNLFPNSIDAFSFFLVWVGGLIALIPLTFLIGLLTGALYNLFARWWGGIRIDLARNEPEKGNARRKNHHSPDHANET
ncbi:MAG: hypothetical protein V1778_04075 [bacterium]